MFDKAAMSPAGEREERTRIVNSLFEKQEGKATNVWKVCVDKPMFTEAKRR